MTRIEEIYHQMIVLCREIKERNERLDALMAEAADIVKASTTIVPPLEKREPVHHVATADPASMHVLAGTLPPNIMKK